MSLLTLYLVTHIEHTSCHGVAISAYLITRTWLLLCSAKPSHHAYSLALGHVVAFVGLPPFRKRIRGLVHTYVYFVYARGCVLYKVLNVAVHGTVAQIDHKSHKWHQDICHYKNITCTDYRLVCVHRQSYIMVACVHISLLAAKFC